MYDDSFADCFRTLARRRPFRPFTIELLTRERLTVTHPEALTFRDGAAQFIEPDRTRRYFDATSVLQVFSLVIPQS